MEVLFVPIITAFIVTIILSFIFKGSPKVDEGFAVNYYKLSYRRKFIRSIIMLPLSIVVIGVVYLITDWSLFVNLIIGVILLVLFIGQITYNYYMWKRNEA